MANDPEQNRSGRVAGKVALVTGAARGIGRVIALTLSEQGATVFITDVLQAGLRETEAAARAAGGEVTALVQDVVSPDAWRSVVDTIGKSHGRLDILVNNAGLCEICSIEDATLESWRRLLAINLDSVFLGLHHCLPLLRASGAASVVNLASGVGIIGVPGLAAYSAAKGGIRSLTKTAAIEFAQRGDRIRVNSVHPGPTDTDRAISLMSQAYGIAPDVARAQGGKALPLGRLGTPKDVASAVLFLASDEAGWITGSELVVDGGDIAR